MKNRIGLVVAVIVALVAVPAIAQEETAPVRSTWQFTDYYLHFGYSMGNYSEGNVDNFRKLAPNATLLNRSLPQRSHLFYSNPPQSTLSILLGISLREPAGEGYKTRHHIRAGITYKNGGGLFSSYSRTDRSTYDVLTSAQTGNVVYLDSVHHQNLSMSYHTEQLRLDGSYLVRTNPDGRFSFFTGLGATAGFSLNSSTNISYYSWHSTQMYNQNNTNYNYSYWYSGNSDNHEHEVFRNKTSYGYSVYIPLGIDFRIARYRGLLSRTHLYLEARPGVDVLVIPELGNYRKSNLTTSLGIRVNL